MEKIVVEDRKVKEIINMSANLNEGERKKVALILIASTLNDLAVENTMKEYLKEQKNECK